MKAVGVKAKGYQRGLLLILSILLLFFAIGEAGHALHHDHQAHPNMDCLVCALKDDVKVLLFLFLAFFLLAFHDQQRKNCCLVNQVILHLRSDLTPVRLKVKSTT